jgi:hypothetical protein
MSYTTPHGRLVIGLGAVAGAVAAAALMSAVGTPTARADSLTDLVNAVQGDLTLGQVDFTAASGDFASSHLADGFAALVTGLDNDFVSTSDNILAGSVALLTNETVPGSLSINVTDPGTFAAALTDVQQDITASQPYATEAATALAAGEYAAYTFDSLIASDLTGVIPAEQLFLGALDALGI